MAEKNFWQDLTSAWKYNGQEFLSGLPTFIAQSGLNLGASWLGGLLENKLDFNSYRKKADYQFSLSEQMAQNAYNRQLEFWNMQNAYNTPKAMVGRMADAGLNPAQSITPQPAGGLSSVSTPMPSASSSRPNIASGLQSFSEILTAVKQMGLLDQETELKAKELISRQLDNDLKTIARATGYSDAQIKEMDRRAQWENIYGDDVPIPDNPFINDLFPMSMVRNPHTQNYRAGEQGIETSEAQEKLLQAQERLSSAQKTLVEADTDTARNAAKTELALAARAWADASLLKAQKELAYKRDKREDNADLRAQQKHEKEQLILTAEKMLKDAQKENIVSKTELQRYELELAKLKSNPAEDWDGFYRKMNILIHDFAGNIISGVL